jgi:hypothetical protein
VFDWPLDERWFKDNFCRANFQYCDTLDASHRAGTQHKHAEVHYFSQSLCSNSSFTFSQRYATACDPFGCTRRTWQISAGPMPPRIVYHEYWTGPKGADGKYRQWTATITSDQGNYVGLSYFGYTT